MSPSEPSPGGNPPPPPDGAPPQPKIGRFEVRAPLGVGGMGIVYAAWDPDLQREVAVKLLRRDRLRPEQIEAASELLRREAQTAARLAHPNVVTIYDVGRHLGQVYVAMELVQGPSLAKWMTDTPRTWREVLNMFFQAGRGLAAAHGVGLLHRDFKPANVLVGVDHRPRVVDFGLAHFGEIPGGPGGEVPWAPGPTETVPGRNDADDASVTIGDGRLADVLSDPSMSGVRSAAASGVFDASSTGVFDAGVTGSWEMSRSRDALSSGRVDVTSSVTSSITSSTSVSASVSLLDGSLDQRALTAEPRDPTVTTLCVGTPAYMAPELFTGAGADARTDQFAFCVALYEGLAGERPFEGQTAKEIAHNVTHGIVRPWPARSRVPGWVRAIVMRGLALDPGERHPSINSMLAAIAFTARIMWD